MVVLVMIKGLVFVGLVFLVGYFMIWKPIVGDLDDKRKDGEL